MTSSHKHSTSGKLATAGDVDARITALDARLKLLESAGQPPNTPTETPLSDLPGWTLRAVANFDGPLDPALWYFYPTSYRDTAEQRRAGTGCYYDPARATMHDGLLDMHIGTINGVRRACAIRSKVTDPRGIRVLWGGLRADRAVGYKIASILWPFDGIWPLHGEEDWPEGDLDGSTVTFFHHYAQQAGIEPHQDYFPSSATFDQPHDYVMEFLPGQSVTSYLDGALHRKTTTKVSTVAMNAVIQAETNLDGAIPDSSVHGHVYLNRIGIWVPS